MLALIDPERYGVIDQRVWRVLYVYGEVAHTSKGINLGQAHWHEYLPIIRQYAASFGVTVRGAERALYVYHASREKLG